MAFMTRRWKVLLVLNLLAVGGFITFWGKCNIRTSKGIGLEASADVRRHTRLNISGQDTSITNEILLRRLGSLEDVVYRQLNGTWRQQTSQPKFVEVDDFYRLTIYLYYSTDKYWVCLPSDCYKLCSTGLSKSLGLVEGFGGRGRGGLPATLAPAEEKEAKYLKEKYGYNAYLSDKISLDRSIPDYRTRKWV